jgi:hypothetical protein
MPRIAGRDDHRSAGADCCGFDRGTSTFSMLKLVLTTSLVALPVTRREVTGRIEAGWPFSENVRLLSERIRR